MRGERSKPGSWYPTPNLIAPYVERKLIRREVDATAAEPRAIYTYTERCHRSGAWDAVTRRCRGLVLEERTGRLLGRPFDKFFELNEMPESSIGAIPWDDDAVVSDKLDGVMGIIFFDGTSWQITAYWAFESDVGGYARERLFPRLALDRLDPAYTYIVEIIIRDLLVGVLKYDYEGLVLIGRRHLVTGRMDWPTDLPAIAEDIRALPLPILEPAMPLRDYAVSMKEQWHEGEGVVLRFANDLMVKVVCNEYHRRFSEIHGDEEE